MRAQNTSELSEVSKYKIQINYQNQMAIFFIYTDNIASSLFRLQKHGTERFMKAPNQLLQPIRRLPLHARTTVQEKTMKEKKKENALQKIFHDL